MSKKRPYAERTRACNRTSSTAKLAGSRRNKRLVLVQTRASDYPKRGWQMFYHCDGSFSHAERIGYAHFNPNAKWQPDEYGVIAGFNSPPMNLGPNSPFNDIDDMLSTGGSLRRTMAGHTPRPKVYK